MSSILENRVQALGYFIPSVSLVRGTDGSVGTTSFPYGQAYARVTKVAYNYMVPISVCPLNMGARFNYPSSGTIQETDCSCVFNTDPQLFGAFTGTYSSNFLLDETYYQPLASTILNADNAVNISMFNTLKPWNTADFSSFLGGNAAFGSAFPGWENCVIWDAANGPPAAKLPVAALTTTVSMTVAGIAAKTSPTPAPEPQPQPPGPKPTPHVIPASIPGPEPPQSPETMPTPESTPNFEDTQPNLSVPGTKESALALSPAPGPSPSPNSGPATSPEPPNEPVSEPGPAPNPKPNPGSGSSDNSDDSSSSDTNLPPGSGGPENSGSDNSSPPGNSDAPGDSSGQNDVAPGGSDDSNPSQGSSPSNSGLTEGSSGTGSQVGSEQGSGSDQTSPDSGTAPGPNSGSETSNNSPPPTAPFVITANGQTISGTVHGSNAAVIAGTTILAGSPASSAAGALISVHPGASSIAVNGNSQPLPTPVPKPAAAPSPLPIASVGSHVIKASPGASEVYFAGTTLSQGGPHATIDNTEIYVGSSGLVVGGSSTIPFPTSPSSGSSPDGEAGAVTFTAAGHTFTSSPSGVAVGGTVIEQGSQAVVSGTTISYGSSGLAIGTTTIPIPTPPPQAGSGSSGSGPTHVFTLGDQTFTANPTAVYISGTTLIAGGSPVTISGTPVSLGSAGIVIASSTYSLPSNALPSSTMVVGDETFTIRPTAIEIAGTTLSVGGPAITVSGTSISLGPSGLIVAGSTVPYRSGPLTAASQTSEGIGGVILAGFGPSTTTTTGTSATAGVEGFTGMGSLGKSLDAVWVLGSLLVGGWIACVGLMWI